MNTGGNLDMRRIKELVEAVRLIKEADNFIPRTGTLCLREATAENTETTGTYMEEAMREYLKNGIRQKEVMQLAIDIIKVDLQYLLNLSESALKEIREMEETL